MVTTEQLKIFRTRGELEGHERMEVIQEEYKNWMAEHANIEIVERCFTESNGGRSVAVFYIEKPATKKPAKAASIPRSRGNLKVAK